MRKYLIPIAGLCLIMIIILCVRITGRVNDNTYSEAVATPERETTLYNVWIDSYENGVAGVFCEGIMAKFNVNDDELKNTITVGTVADITVLSEEIKSINYKSDRINDRILSVNENGLETSSRGSLKFNGNYRIYGIYDGIRQLSKEDINIGYTVSDIVLENNEVCAVLITGEVTPDKIRVAIMTTGYKGYYHNDAVLSSDAGMVLNINGTQYPYEAGQEAYFNTDNEFLKQGRITVSALNGGRLTIKNVMRNGENRMYRGNIELALTESGIVIINELLIDEYLYAVVPSEMPVSYNIEALKAQAVCARSYAYMQVSRAKLGNIGAHVDDSTSYQVYNNTSETPESIRAVNETSGCVLTYGGKVVSAYYFSTSCGYTANGSDVWLGMKNAEYLSAALQNDVQTDEVYDLKDGRIFRQFIDNPPVSTYDSTFAWYRWKVTLTAAQIKDSYEKKIEDRYKANSSLFLVKQKDGSFVSGDPKDIGDIKKIKIGKRTDGGIITALIIKGSKKTVKILSEYNIRILLAPYTSNINRNDGSIVSGLSLLPSAFFYIDKKQNSYTFCGGGYGHGVGMSQNGAGKMADSGCTFSDILLHYYKGCEITLSPAPVM